MSSPTIEQLTEIFSTKRLDKAVYYLRKTFGDSPKKRRLYSKFGVEFCKWKNIPYCPKQFAKNKEKINGGNGQDISKS